MKALALATLAVAALALANDVDPSDFRFTRELAAGPGAAVRFEPDGPMYAHARADFADLRILDSAGDQVPWRTEPLPAAVAPTRVVLVARGQLGGVRSVVVDRGPAPEVIDRIELDVPDRTFVGSVEVSGSATGEEGSYATLSTTKIFSVRGAVAARSTTAVFPATDYRYLLIAARGVTDITGATVARDPQRAQLEPVPATVDVRQGDGATVVRLDLGYADVPTDAVEVRSTTDRFVREVLVEGSNGGGAFVPIGGGKVARFDGVDLDRIPVDGHHRVVRVTIRNGDDAPLESLAVEALAAPRPLLLAEGFTPPYDLYYGAAAVAAPAYDFALLPPGATGFERAVQGTLGEESRNDLFQPPADTRTFFEKNSSAVTALLVAAALVVAVGGVLALRRRS